MKKKSINWCTLIGCCRRERVHGIYGGSEWDSRPKFHCGWPSCIFRRHRVLFHLEFIETACDVQLDDDTLACFRILSIQRDC